MFEPYRVTSGGEGFAITYGNATAGFRFGDTTSGM